MLPDRMTVVEPLCYEQWGNSTLQNLDGTETVPGPELAWAAVLPVQGVCKEFKHHEQAASSVFYRQQLQFFSHKIQVIQRIRVHPYTTNPALPPSRSDGRGFQTPVKLLNKKDSLGMSLGLALQDSVRSRT